MELVVFERVIFIPRSGRKEGVFSVIDFHREGREGEEHAGGVTNKGTSWAASAMETNRKKMDIELRHMKAVSETHWVTLKDNLDSTLALDCGRMSIA